MTQEQVQALMDKHSASVHEAIDSLALKAIDLEGCENYEDFHRRMAGIVQLVNVMHDSFRIALASADAATHYQKPTFSTARTRPAMEISDEEASGLNTFYNGVEN